MAYTIQTWNRIAITTEQNLDDALATATNHTKKSGELTHVVDADGDGYEVSLFDGEVFCTRVDEPDWSDPHYWDED